MGSRSDALVRPPQLEGWPGRGSLRNKIVTRAFVPTAIILTSVALVSLYAYQRVTENLVVERDRELTRLSARLLGSELATYTDPMAERYLTIFDGVVVFTPNGTVLTAEPEQYEEWDPKWFRGASLHQILQSSEPVFSDVLTQGINGERVVVVVMPLEGRQGESMGGIAGLFRLSPGTGSALYRSLEKLQRGESRGLYLVDSVGSVIYHTNEAYIGEDFGAQQVVQEVIRGEVGAYRTRDFDGHEIVASFAPVPGTSWGLVTEESWAMLIESSHRYGRFLFLLLGLGIVAPILIVTVGVRRITQPIAALIQAAREITSGNLNQRIHASSGDEVEALAEQFNRMAAELFESYTHLEQRVADRTRELAVLNALAAEVSHSLDLAEVLRSAIDEVLDAMGMERGMAFRLDPEAGSLVLIAHQGWSEPLVQQATHQTLEAGARGAAVRERRVVVQELAGTAEDGLDRLMGEGGVRQLIGIPLLAKGKTVGVLELAARRPRHVGAEERSLLTGVGHQIGVAVENARLFEQAQQLAVMQERNRLAGDLHDSVTQALYGVSLCAEAAARELGSGGTDTAAHYLRAIQGTTLEALREMRLLLFELRPPMLKEDGLAGALRARLEAVEERLGVQTELEVEGDGALPKEVEGGLYRVAQEALNNALKHAQAEHVWVRLRQTADSLELEIEDDGVGFDPAVARGQGGFGLQGMEERATSLGGQLVVRSAPGQGSRLHLRLALQEAEVST